MQVAGGPARLFAGGEANTNSGVYATVPGGFNNFAGGNFSLAAGRRAKATHPGFRFQAFWNQGHDWMPDQCHGGGLMTALQYMLLQWDPPSPGGSGAASGVEKPVAFVFGPEHGAVSSKLVSNAAREAYQKSLQIKPDNPSLRDKLHKLGQPQ